MGSNSSSNIITMRLIIFTLSALLAFAVAEREFNLCAREEKVCPGGVKPSEAVRDRETPLPLDHQEQEPPMGQIDISLCWTRHNIGSNRYHTLYAHRFSSEY